MVEREEDMKNRSEREGGRGKEKGRYLDRENVRIRAAVTRREKKRNRVGKRRLRNSDRVVNRGTKGRIRQEVGENEKGKTSERDRCKRGGKENVREGDSASK